MGSSRIDRQKISLEEGEFGWGTLKTGVVGQKEATEWAKKLTGWWEAREEEGWRKREYGLLALPAPWLHRDHAHRSKTPRVCSPFLQSSSPASDHLPHAHAALSALALDLSSPLPSFPFAQMLLSFRRLSKNSKSNPPANKFLFAPPFASGNLHKSPHCAIPISRKKTTFSNRKDYKQPRIRQPWSFQKAWSPPPDEICNSNADAWKNTNSNPKKFKKKRN